MDTTQINIHLAYMVVKQKNMLSSYSSPYLNMNFAKTYVLSLCYIITEFGGENINKFVEAE